MSETTRPDLFLFKANDLLKALNQASSQAQFPRKLRVLLIDESRERADILREQLLDAGVGTVICFQDTIGLLDKVLQLKPDLVLAEIDSPQRDTIEQLTSVTNRLPVMLVANDRSKEAINAAMKAGVASYVVDSVKPEQIQPAIDIAIATFRRLRSLRKELDTAQNNSQQRATIDKAKRLLIKQYDYTENDAYRALQKLAMDTNRKLVEVAADLERFSKIFH